MSVQKAFKYEKSAGFLIFKRNGQLKYLLLKTKGRFDVPKGQLNKGEGELQGALRELKEETGITDVKIVPGFKKNVRYFYRWIDTLIKKEVVYFLGEVGTYAVTLSSEHDGFSWMTKEEIMSQVKYKNLKQVVAVAESMLLSKP
jgi:bis(5'-nucleosidyl)-tetraphosphatase